MYGLVILDWAVTNGRLLVRVPNCQYVWSFFYETLMLPLYDMYNFIYQSIFTDNNGNDNDYESNCIAMNYIGRMTCDIRARLIEWK